jgi:hypothetical protein
MVKGVACAWRELEKKQRGNQTEKEVKPKQTHKPLKRLFSRAHSQGYAQTITQYIPAYLLPVCLCLECGLLQLSQLFLFGAHLNHNYLKLLLLHLQGRAHTLQIVLQKPME